MGGDPLMSDWNGEQKLMALGMICGTVIFVALIIASVVGDSL
jgi:hypothetical protein